MTSASGGWSGRLAGLTAKEVPDVGVDGADFVHVLTRYPAGVNVYAPDGDYVRSYGRAELSERPHAITVARDGTAYVVDEPSHVVRVFDGLGRLTSVLGTPGAASDTGVDDSLPVPQWTATVERAAPPFNHPTKVALDGAGGVYVSDGYGNACIHHFDAAGVLTHSWGEPGTKAGQLNLPHSVVVLADGRVCVADRENDRLQLFTREGSYLEAWTEVSRPTAVAEQADGRIVVSELPWRAGEVAPRTGLVEQDRPARVTLLDSAGDVLERHTHLQTERGSVSLVAPHGVAVDSTGAWYVAEVSFSYTRREHEHTVHKITADDR